MKNMTFLVVAVLATAGCKKDAAESGGAELAKLTELKSAMCACKDATCAQDVSAKLATWTQQKAKAAPVKMSDADAKQAAAIGNEMATCMQVAMAATPRNEPAGSGTEAPAGGSGATAGSDTTAPPDMAGSAAVGADGLPVECAAYKAQVEKLKTCEKLSPRAKEALLKAFNDAAAGWAKMPAGAKAGLDTSCKAATEALVVAGKEACGW